MSSLFETTDYKEFVNEIVAEMPKGGHGQFRRIAQALGVNSVVISQVLRGPRDFTPEQGLKLCKHFGLNRLEIEYFIALIHLARAGSRDLEGVYHYQLDAIRSRARELKTRVPKSLNLSEQVKAVFYSSWHFSAVRLLSSVEGYQNPDQIAARLSIPRSRVKLALDFLTEHGLCVKGADGWRMGPESTHLESDSSFINRHRINWRLKAIERLDGLAETDLSYSGLMVLSRSDTALIRAQLVAGIEKSARQAVASPSEELVCLNLDWFKI